MKTAEGIAHFFVPTHSNNQKARLLHPQILVLLVMKLILIQVAFQFMPASGLKILGYAANIPPEEVIKLTNERRIEVGLHPLEMNEALSQAALAKGTDMINRDYWAHVAPDGTQPWKFFIDAGFKYRFAGENLARDFADASSAVEAWMASPTHRENMLSPKYKEIGIAVVEGDMDGVDTTIIVQFFGTQYLDTTPIVPVAEAKLQSPSPVPASPASTPSPEEEEIGPVGKGAFISPFKTTKGISVIVVSLIFGTLVYDAMVTSKKKVVRIAGRTWAHLSFLAMILAIILILKAGQVI